MMSLWDALRMNMMISYQELVRTFLSSSRVVTNLEVAKPDETTDIAGEHFTQKFVQVIANIRC